MAENHEMTLFVGGPWDGRREVLASYGPKFSVPVFRWCSHDEQTTRMVTVYYDRKVFNASGKQFYFRVPSGMTEAELMDRLVKGYQPAKEEPNV